MADMGIYSLWPVFTTLSLGTPTSAEAWATHTCSIVGQLSRPAKNDFSYPTACTIRFKFAGRADRPAPDLFWYDGGMRPRLPEEIEARNIQMPSQGILFVGDQGTIMGGFGGENPQLFAKGKSEPLWEETSSSQGRSARVGYRERNKQWVQACKGGAQSLGCFLNAGSITDAVNLGTVALRAGEKVVFDSDDMKITNITDANKYLYREYREGWEL